MFLLLFPHFPLFNHYCLLLSWLHISSTSFCSETAVIRLYGCTQLRLFWLKQIQMHPKRLNRKHSGFPLIVQTGGNSVICFFLFFSFIIYRSIQVFFLVGGAAHRLTEHVYSQKILITICIDLYLPAWFCYWTSLPLIFHECMRKGL